MTGQLAVRPLRWAGARPNRRCYFHPRTKPDSLALSPGIVQLLCTCLVQLGVGLYLVGEIGVSDGI